MKAEEIDILAEFCGLNEKGYKRYDAWGDDDEPVWQIIDDYGGCKLWLPHQSDDDFRMVLDAMTQEQRSAFAAELILNVWYVEVRPDWNWIYKIVAATPSDKCKAALAVIGKSK